MTIGKKTGKAMKPVICVIIGFLLLAGRHDMSAQGNPALERFSATESDGVVYLSWTMLTGFTCSGIQVFRSTDSVAFARIGIIPGICGSVSEALSYTYADPDPVRNQVNYYRLELGPYGLSPMASIEVIDHGNLQYQIRPHPVVSSGRIYFDKQHNEEHRHTLYNQTGKVIYTTTTREEFVSLEAGALPSGLYPFTIGPVDKRPSIQGQVTVIQHP
jgi:hypothetical protein